METATRSQIRRLLRLLRQAGYDDPRVSNYNDPGIGNNGSAITYRQRDTNAPYRHYRAYHCANAPSEVIDAIHRLED